MDQQIQILRVFMFSIMDCLGFQVIIIKNKNLHDHVNFWWSSSLNNLCLLWSYSYTLLTSILQGKGWGVHYL